MKFVRRAALVSASTGSSTTPARTKSRVATNSENAPEIVVGLDLGTTKVSAVVGEVDEDGITILGWQ